MEPKKFDIDVEISEIPETPLFQQTKIKGSAKVRIKTFGLILNWIPWVVSQKKVTVTFPAFKRRVDGKYKRFPTVSFIDKHLDRLVCRLIKYKILLRLEELEKKAIEQKRKTKEEAKKKERQKKLAELRVFFALPTEQQNDILWGLWGDSYRKPRKDKRAAKSHDSDWRHQQERQTEYIEMLKKFEVWKKNRLKQMRENKVSLEKMFEQEGGGG